MSVLELVAERVRQLLGLVGRLGRVGRTLLAERPDLLDRGVLGVETAVGRRERGVGDLRGVAETTDPSESARLRDLRAGQEQLLHLAVLANLDRVLRAALGLVVVAPLERGFGTAQVAGKVFVVDPRDEVPLDRGRGRRLVPGSVEHALGVELLDVALLGAAGLEEDRVGKLFLLALSQRRARGPGDGDDDRSAPVGLHALPLLRAALELGPSDSRRCVEKPVRRNPGGGAQFLSVRNSLFALNLARGRS